MLVYGAYDSSCNMEDEQISRYFRRSDALLSDLVQASSDEDEVGTAHLRNSHPQSSPPPSTAFLRPSPQRALFLGPQHTNTSMQDDLVSALEELRLEGARNPFQEENAVLLSESTHLFLCKNAVSASAAASSSPRTSVAMIKPVALRATDLL